MIKWGEFRSRLEHKNGRQSTEMDVNFIKMIKLEAMNGCVILPDKNVKRIIYVLDFSKWNLRSDRPTHTHEISCVNKFADSSNGRRRSNEMKRDGIQFSAAFQ